MGRPDFHRAARAVAEPCEQTTVIAARSHVRQRGTVMRLIELPKHDDARDLAIPNLVGHEYNQGLPCSTDVLFMHGPGSSVHLVSDFGL